MQSSFHVMAKPAGARCNLDCKYCFYLEKEALYPKGSHRMTDEVLENFIRSRFAGEPGSEVHFAWQGGEPTLLGVEFYRKVVRLQHELGDGRAVRNTIQTNGVLIDDEWARFLAEHDFLVGLSIDGPAEMHDRHRVDKGGRPTFAKVMLGLAALRRHGVAFNTLTVVHRDNASHPEEIYQFLKSIGSTHLQFIPLVDREGDSNFATAESVTAEAYGVFLNRVFDLWLSADVGTIHVQLFDVMLGVWMGQPAGLCLFEENCGKGAALEHNGDLYSCDHFVSPRHRLGNLLDRSLGDMMAAPQQAAFGRAKSETLPRQCRECEVLFACRGECPKNRFAITTDGEPGLNHLCAGYRKFLHHANPALRGMAWLAMNGRPPAEIMDVLAEPLSHHQLT